MKLRLTDLLIALVLFAPLGLCVGCECKQDSDCGFNASVQTVPVGVGKAATTAQAVYTAQRKCRDKECKN
jgi:hypothetical protein